MHLLTRELTTAEDSLESSSKLDREEVVENGVDGRGQVHTQFGEEEIPIIRRRLTNLEQSAKVGMRRHAPAKKGEK